jgi:hypothetical protein
MSALFTADEYQIKTKVFDFFHQKFSFHDLQGNLIGYAKKKALKLKEDLVIYADQSMQIPLVAIKARSIIDFGATYDIADAQTGENLGSTQRKGMRSLLKDTYYLNDAAGQKYGEFIEDSNAILRRIIPIIPARYHIEIAGQENIYFQQGFNPFFKTTTVRVPNGHQIDRRVVAAMALISSAVEGRQGR